MTRVMNRVMNPAMHPVKTNCTESNTNPVEILEVRERHHAFEVIAGPVVKQLSLRHVSSNETA